jgi:hypothetical protein
VTLTVEDALAPLPETYHQLYRQVLAVCEPDERIRGLWLSGSLARGNADGGSDLDLLLAVDDDATKRSPPSGRNGWRRQPRPCSPSGSRRPRF